MRNLTIKRTKSFVGCLGKMKVYVEDPSSTEITINGVPCRKLGDLKNGEEKTFQIDYFAVKVFVIADKLSKGYCSEFYQLPDGSEDVFLSGKNRYSPASGNPFRFDNNNNEEVKALRKRNTRKGWIVLLIAAIVGGILGFAITTTLFPSNDTPKDGQIEPKTFIHEDMSITLTNEFKQRDFENFEVVYGTPDVSVFVVKESFTLMDGLEDYTVKQYLELVTEVNALDASFKTADGHTYITHVATNPDSQTTYRYYCFAFKADDAFWLIQFATAVENIEEYEEQIIEWAKTVTISE